MRGRIWILALFAIGAYVAYWALANKSERPHLSGGTSTAGTRASAPLDTDALIDSRVGIESPSIYDRHVAWIDDERVLFIAMEPSQAASPAVHEKFTYSLKVWNFRTGKFKTVRSFGPNGAILCYDEGAVLYYSRRADGSYEAYQGKLGSEHPVDLSDGYKFRFCRPLTKATAKPSWTKEREIRWLEKPGAGFLDFGPFRGSMNNTPIRLYKPGARQSEGLELPFGRRDIEPRFPYFRFANAFFVESSYYLHPRPENIPYPVYWLFENGRIEKIADIPWGPWRSSGGFSMTPVRPGILMVSNNARSPSQIHHAGIYLLRDGRVEKLVPGWIVGMKVSPNGCNVALNYAPYMSRKVNTLRVLKLCEAH